MVNLITIAVACVSVWYDPRRRTPPRRFFCHAAADFGIKRRRASLIFPNLYQNIAAEMRLKQLRYEL